MDEVGGGGGSAGGAGGSESGGGGGGGGRSGTTSVEVGGERLRFRVELRPGETTIVSWKKLLKDANAHGHGAAAAAAAMGSSSTAAGASASASKPNGPGPGPDPAAPSSFSTQVNNHDNIPGPPPPPHPPSMDPRLAPVSFSGGQVGEKGETDAPQPPNRLNTVIERIERLYVGRASSDEEDLNDVVPDDDEYDTEDSFIDDTELDEYFQVDNSAIKHDGFFVNRGKLERVEPSMLPNEQPKKRRRKDGKGLDGSDDALNPGKHLKAGKKAGKPVPMFGRNASGLPTVIALPNVHGEDLKFQNQVNALEVSSKKRSHDSGEQPPLGVMNGDAVTLGKVAEQQKLGTHLANNQGNQMKEGCEYSDTSNQRSQEKTSYSQSKPLPGKALNNAALDQSIPQKEKSGIRERSEVGVADSKNSMQNVRVSYMQKREGSSARPKSTLLEKAIRDLEKIVAESRPPTAEAQDADNSSQGVKRRLPPEIKQKLAKVARLAASHGKISKELVNRLMSIVGHLIQLRTLKRNLKIMVSMGLSAKQEKDNRVQLVKKEVAEMIKMRIPFMKSKAAEQQAGTSDDFQEISAEEKEAFKRKYSLDDALEDKICDLYDLYIEGLEEDAGPQVRKLYAELTALWPSGFMDNHGIKRAIYRAKDRRRALYSRHKDPEKIKRKKMLARKTEAARMEAHTVAQPVYIQEKSVADSSDHGTVLVNRPASSNTVAGAAVRMPVNFLNGSNVDRPKQEKIKGSASTHPDAIASEILQSKKIKRKSETELGDAAQFRPEKLLSVQVDDKNKSHKVQVAGSLPKSNPHPTAPTNFEQHFG
ncbi:ubinuclein-1-like isoform X2 [Coffea eugenioides]|uniref:ubinuclein-1-like isoform X2 n=1 Tax=Coffea eugenioides TaxID=49369 RepID=UPI000F60E822|nr:ubinuclein-1-like isoform X2 [Coffea eugenioides]